jgi:5-methylcytosine-specific restriction enzyme A
LASRHDRRSAEAAAYRRLYGTARWKRIREHQLASQPLCEFCLRIEVIEPATIVHHSGGGHKGDEERFWSGPFMSTCKPCHDWYGADEDAGREVVIIGLDGYPA